MCRYNIIIYIRYYNTRARRFVVTVAAVVGARARTRTARRLLYRARLRPAAAAAATTAAAAVASGSALATLDQRHTPYTTRDSATCSQPLQSRRRR